MPVTREDVNNKFTRLFH